MAEYRCRVDNAAGLRYKGSTMDYRAVISLLLVGRCPLAVDG